jgi:cytochrome P460
MPKRALLLVAAAGLMGLVTPGSSPRVLPRYAADGALIRPNQVETWILVGASLGLGYSDDRNASGPGTFHNVYLEPHAYRMYVETGRFPDKTMLAMLLFQPAQKTPPSRRGLFEGEPAGLEVAVKDGARFEGGWAYFGFGLGGPGSSARAFPRESCARCHSANAADDNVFVQFYPQLRSILASRRGQR